MGPSDKEEWREGPVNISAQCQVAPSLLRMTWDGFPLHFTRKHGWGYLVPGRTDNLTANQISLPQNEEDQVDLELQGPQFPTGYMCSNKCNNKTCVCDYSNVYLVTNIFKEEGVAGTLGPQKQWGMPRKCGNLRIGTY